MTNNSIKAAFQRFWEHVVAQLNGKADVNHTHDYADSVHNHDDIYYTESEIDNRFETMGTAFVDAFTTKEETAQAVETIVELMVDKADKNDLNYKADKDHNHDDIYYTESEIDAKLSEVSESIDNLIDVAETKEDASAKLAEAKAYADEVGSSLQTQLNTIVNNPDTEGVINSINEFTQYITEHGEIAEGFRTDIDSKASKETVNGHIEDKVVHITSEEREAWNVAEENAKTYTDEQIGSHTHSWNDLEDKPFGEETGEITVVAEAEYVAKSMGGQDYFDLVMLEDIIPNETYRIILNGVEYTAVADGTNLSFGVDPQYGDALYGIETNYFMKYEYNGGQSGTVYTIAVYRVGTSIEYVKTLDEKYIPDTIARVSDIPECDWNTMKNKPFYETNEVTSVILEEQTFEVHPNTSGSPFAKRTLKSASFSITELLVKGETYKVTLNGVEYICTAYQGGFGLVLGEYDTTDLEVKETLSYPFSFATTLDVIDDLVVDDTITVKIEHGNFGFKQLDEKFIPDTIARVSDMPEIPEGFSGSWNDLTDKPFGEIVEQGVLCEDMSWNGIVKYDISVGKWQKCDELIPNIVDVVNTLNGVRNAIVGYLNEDVYLEISEDSRVVYGYEHNYSNVYKLRYLIILEDNVTTTVESDELTFANSGFYTNNGVEGVHPITYSYTQLKTLDEQYISDAIARKTDVEPALSLATEAIITNTETISLHTEQIAALQTDIATIIEITVEEVDALFNIIE